MAPLTDDQKEQKAINIIKNIELQSELSDIHTTIDNLFNDTTIAIASTISKEELHDLITKINDGTATNNKISRFLDIASSLGI
jgi:hypothetical protein